LNDATSYGSNFDRICRCPDVVVGVAVVVVDPLFAALMIAPLAEVEMTVVTAAADNTQPEIRPKNISHS